MGYIVPNDLLNEHECPLAVIKCVDFRFRESDQEFVEKHLGYKNFDLYAWPGSAKDVLKNNGFKMSFTENIVAVSKNLHHVKKLLLLWNWDCESYGGSSSFASASDEESAYIKDLQTVRAMLSKDLPQELEIIMAYSKPVPQGLDYIVIE